MTSLRIPMRPVNDAALFATFELAVKRHGVPGSEGRYPGRKIDVVRYEQGPARIDFQNESLMATAVVVVRQNTQHLAGPLNLLPGSPPQHWIRAWTRKRTRRPSTASGPSTAASPRWLPCRNKEAPRKNAVTRATRRNRSVPRSRGPRSHPHDPARRHRRRLPSSARS